MLLDLTTHDQQTVVTLLKAFLPETTIWAFGSRMKFTSKPESDLDLVAFIEPEQQSQLAELKDAFVESDLPFKVDILDWNIIPDNFKENIKKDYVVLVASDEVKIPENWKSYPLGQIIQLIGGGTPKTSISEYWNGEIPWLSVTDFGGGRKYVYETEKSITEIGLKESSTKVLPKGHIIISARGTVGELAVLGRPMAFNQSCYGITSKEKTTNEFLYYLIKQSVLQIKQNTHGAVFDTITKQTFDNIEVVIPDDIATQNLIASILSSFDDKIELNIGMNQTLENAAQTIFKEWFVKFNFPGFDGKLVDGLPKGWKMLPLGEMVFVKGGTTPSTTVSDYWDGEFYWTTPKDLSNIKSPVLLDTERKITMYGVNQIGSGILPKGTLLLSSRAPIGYLAISQIPISINQGYIAIIGNKVSNLFMLFWLKQNMEIVKGRSNGSTFQEISKSKFKEIIAILPNDDVLVAFDRVINPIFEKIVSNEKENRTLSQLRDNLLPKLMTGKIQIRT